MSLIAIFTASLPNTLIGNLGNALDPRSKHSGMTILHRNAELSIDSAALRELRGQVKVSALPTQSLPRHPRAFLSGIQRIWIPAPRLRGGRLFTGMTAKRMAA
ncbi:hypothetical protein CSQ88_14385 [Iodobacter sp. BJB302]|nr:hypothetical protein CSQ88_14385 [Iodobacter sp. BJB302]